MNSYCTQLLSCFKRIRWAKTKIVIGIVSVVLMTVYSLLPLLLPRLYRTTTPMTYSFRITDENSDLYDYEADASVADIDSNKMSKPKLKKVKPVLYSEQKGSSGKMILWHMTPRYRQAAPERVLKCSKHRCVLTSERSRLAVADAVIVDAFLLSRRHSRDKPLRTSPNQAWIFFTKEPWANYAELFPAADWDGIFNWTMTYQKDSDIFSPYGEVAVRKESEMEKTDWDEVMKIKTHSAFWLVSHCKTASEREIYVDQLKKHIDVDIVGHCGRERCKKNGAWEDVADCFKRSKFYLAFESTFCQDYVTEKFFRMFNYHIIPVVRGKTDYSSLCPKDLYINTADFESPEKLAEYLNYLDRNTTAYLGYLKRRAKYRVINVGHRVCEICSKLQDLDKYRKSYKSITKWIGRCKKPKQPDFV